jgi:hypothetical protein
MLADFFYGIFNIIMERVPKVRFSFGFSFDTGHFAM